jgi:bacteriocin-like protein
MNEKDIRPRSVDELSDDELEAISGGVETPASAALRAMIKRAFANHSLAERARRAAEQGMRPLL